MSSPAYVRWAKEQIQAGMADAGRQHHRLVVHLDVKVGKDSNMARTAIRRSLADRLPWADVQLTALGIAEEVNAFIRAHGPEGVAQHMPDEWVDAFSAAGTPEQVTERIQCLMEAGADSIVFQPLDGDADCLEEYAHHVMPRLKAVDFR
jgi:alkanesulfonate monooxygenase SsuD/methylene tetrahydromethanopterin reductase-like flavin-dependent oxidoreductase (luciferase family)